MASFTPGSSTLGGAIIGLAMCALLLCNGRIAGISGIVGEIPTARAGDRAWRWLFLFGMLSGGALVLLTNRAALAFASEQSGLSALAAGILVGVGSRLSGGCTSGHGLCGIARLSGRSVLATLIFMATGAITVFLVRHVAFGATAAGAP